MVYISLTALALAILVVTGIVCVVRYRRRKAAGAEFASTHYEKRATL